MDAYKQAYSAWLVQDGQWVPAKEMVVCEVSVHIFFEGVLVGTVSCAPEDLNDLVYGFLYAKGCITRADDVASFQVVQEDGVWKADVRFSPECESREKENLSFAKERGADTSTKKAFVKPQELFPMVSCEIMTRAGAQLAEQRVLHRSIRDLHAAVFLDLHGFCRYVREDIGRHNALDKLIGALLRDNIDPLEGFVHLSGQCSCDLIKKCERYGIRLVSMVAVPTVALVRFAEEHNVTLCSFMRKNKFIVYAHPERIYFSPSKF